MTVINAIERLARGLSKTVDELPQDLFWTFVKIALPFLAEEGSEFGFGDDKVRFLEDGHHALITQGEGDSEFL